MPNARGAIAGLLLAAGLTIGGSTASALTLPPSGKGWGFNGQVSPSFIGSSVRPEAQLAGATHMRDGIHWAGYAGTTSPTNPVDPSLDPVAYPVGSTTPHSETNRVDAAYIELTAHGITPIIAIHGVPFWASTFHACTTEGSPGCPAGYDEYQATYYPAADRMTQYDAWVTAVARRYPLAIIEGANEPDADARISPTLVPPITDIVRAQCALASAVRALGNPGQAVFSSGMYDLLAADSHSIPAYLDEIEARESSTGTTCYDNFSFHLYGGWDTRSGVRSGLQEQLADLRGRLSAAGNGNRQIWITETGMSNTLPSNGLNGDGPWLSEITIAHATQRWLETLLAQADIGGVLVHTIVADQSNPNVWQRGFGFLDTGLSPKVAGGQIPRWCFLALSAGNSDPDCSSWSLPSPPANGAPTFFAAPSISDTTPHNNDELHVDFLEDATPPATSVQYRWARCNLLNACANVGEDVPWYRLGTSNLAYKLKVTVTVQNSYGTATYTTPLTASVLP